MLPFFDILRPVLPVLAQVPSVGTPTQDVALITAISAIAVALIAAFGARKANQTANNPPAPTPNKELDDLRARVEALEHWADTVTDILNTTPDRATIGSIRARLPRRP